MAGRAPGRGSRAGWTGFACAVLSACDGPSETLLRTDAALSGHHGTLGCGDVVQRDTTLTQDIGPCVGDGIVMVVDDVTLDCAGHHIRGVVGSAGRGIILGTGTGMKVKNCVIEGFTNGLWARNAVGNDFTRNRFVGQGNKSVDDTCVDIVSATAFRFEDNRFEDCRIAMRLEDTYVFDVRDNDVRRGFGGFVLEGVNEGHRFHDNHVADVLGDINYPAFWLGGLAQGNRLDGNEVEDSDYAFVLYDDATGNLREHNEVRRSGFGSYVLLRNARRNVLRHNEAHDNGGDGFLLANDANDNLLHGNEADDNGGAGFYLTTAATGNVLDGNEACGNVQPDIFVGTGAGPTRLFDNDACTTLVVP